MRPITRKPRPVQRAQSTWRLASGQEGERQSKGMNQLIGNERTTHREPHKHTNAGVHYILLAVSFPTTALARSDVPVPSPTLPTPFVQQRQRYRAAKKNGTGSVTSGDDGPFCYRLPGLPVPGRSHTVGCVAFQRRPHLIVQEHFDRRPFPGPLAQRS